MFLWQVCLSFKMRHNRPLIPLYTVLQAVGGNAEHTSRLRPYSTLLHSITHPSPPLPGAHAFPAKPRGSYYSTILWFVTGPYLVSLGWAGRQPREQPERQPAAAAAAGVAAASDGATDEPLRPEWFRLPPHVARLQRFERQRRRRPLGLGPHRTAGNIVVRRIYLPAAPRASCTGHGRNILPGTEGGVFLGRRIP